MAGLTIIKRISQLTNFFPVTSVCSVHQVKSHVKVYLHNALRLCSYWFQRYRWRKRTSTLLTVKLTDWLKLCKTLQGSLKTPYTHITNNGFQRFLLSKRHWQVHYFWNKKNPLSCNLSPTSKTNKPLWFLSSLWSAGSRLHSCQVGSHPSVITVLYLRWGQHQHCDNWTRAACHI